MTSTQRKLPWVLLLFVVALGCSESTAIDDAGARDGTVGDATGDATVDALPPPGPTGMADILFVIDDSHSMAGAQNALSNGALRAFFAALVTGDGSGAADVDDFAPLDDLHIGVVTTDMGIYGALVPTCGEGLGDDGVLQVSEVLPAGCDVGMPPMIRYDGTGSLDALDTELNCLTRVGTMGCGIEQPLEAALKALTAVGSPLRFYGDSTGHGDEANLGFRRPEATLAIIVVTDEDDCSLEDTSMLVLYLDQYNRRCPGAHPTSRYVDGFLDLAGDAGLFFGAIMGIPPELAETAYDDVASDPRFLGEEHESGFFAFNCTRDDGVAAKPGQRLLETADLLDDRAVTDLESVCDGDLTVPMRRFAARLGALAGGR